MQCEDVVQRCWPAQHNTGAAQSTASQPYSDKQLHKLMWLMEAQANVAGEGKLRRDLRAASSV